MFYPDPYGTPIEKFEIFSRLYGQIAHGATSDQIPNNVGTPYARPDTIFRDQWYTYAVTPYDRYGNLNTRDTMYVNIGTRLTTWEFTGLSAMGASGNLEIAAGGRFFEARPVGFPQNTQLRHDSLILYNLSLVGAGNRNDFVGIKPDDPRLGDAVGDRAGSALRHGILPANAIAVRPVDIKKPYAPAPFTLKTPLNGNSTLFRMDHVGRCTDTSGAPIQPSTSLDILQLNWQPSVWKGVDAGQQNPNDTIRYEWFAIIDSVYGVTGVDLSTKPLVVSQMADNDGKSAKITINGSDLWTLIFRPNLLPQPNGQDSLVMRVKWFVKAFSKIDGLETYSDTAGVTVRDNPLPTEPLIVSINRLPDNPPTAVQPTNGATEFVDGTTPLDILWSAADDINNRRGARITGNAAPGPFMLFNPVTKKWGLDPARTVDTLSYQWIGVVKSTSPVGKGAPIGATIVVNAGSSTGIQLSTADLDALFGGFDPDPASNSADSVKVDWFVATKDANFTEFYNSVNPMEVVEFPYKEGLFLDPVDAVNGDTSRFSPTSCQPHWIKSGPFRVALTKLKDGGVEIDPIASDPELNALVGEKLCFTLTAKDENGNIIRDWDSPDKNNPATTVVINNSSANTDSSDQSWNGDPDGYTWARVELEDGTPLTQISANEFSVPASAFVDGVVRICIIHTKAEKGVQLEVQPTVANLNQLSSLMNFGTDEVTNYLVDIFPSTAADNQVYWMRLYEMWVSPRDQYMNVVENRTVRTRFTARFPGEYDDTQAGLSNIFSGDVFITGETNFFLASRISRIASRNDQLQWIKAYSAVDPTVDGTTDEYEILDHAPNAFALQTPADKTVWKLAAAANQQQFTWVKAVPQDPYNNIQIRRDDPTTKFSDVVSYSITFVDSISLTRAVTFASDNSGMGATFTTNEGQLAGIIDQISGLPTTVSQAVVWFVEATDGDYITKSTPPNGDPANRPGYRLRLTKEGILGVEDGKLPTEYSLGQNYPNPFNPSTTISYSLPKSSQVTMVIFDLLGTPVKTIINDMQDAGSYKVVWNATNDNGVQVPSGNYIIKIVAGDFTATRKMTLLK